jgi:GNAT superfamily N-acetyltransferase
MISLTRTNSENKDFIALVKLLDADLAKRDGEDHAFYAQFNKIDMIRQAVVAFEDGTPVGCGAIKEFAPGVMEVKRMYTSIDHRKKGIASKVLDELEKWGLETGYAKAILETGTKQFEAIAMYSSLGYERIDNYGQYAGIANSVCFEKQLTKK